MYVGLKQPRGDGERYVTPARAAAKETTAVRTERSEICTKTTERQYFPVRLELARLVSSLLYGTRAMLVLNLPAFDNKKYIADDRFQGNGQ